MAAASGKNSGEHRPTAPTKRGPTCNSRFAHHEEREISPTRGRAARMKDQIACMALSPPRGSPPRMPARMRTRRVSLHAGYATCSNKRYLQNSPTSAHEVAGTVQSLGCDSSPQGTPWQTQIAAPPFLQAFAANAIWYGNTL